jgi:hypothetical protein
MRLRNFELEPFLFEPPNEKWYRVNFLSEQMDEKQIH